MNSGRFAILDGPTMPIIGEGEEEANDRYNSCSPMINTYGVSEIILCDIIASFGLLIQSAIRLLDDQSPHLVHYVVAPEVTRTFF
jgi:hypothetical protein